jgi:putative spermidine/putrescine transport system substrate-binding protein
MQMTSLIKIGSGRALIAAAAICGWSAPAPSQESVSLVTYGGPLQEAEMKALYEPTAKKLGITVKVYTMPSTARLANLRAQVQSGNVSYDLIAIAGSSCQQIANGGLTEELDYRVVDRSGFPPELVGKNWIAINTQSTVLAYNTKVYGQNGPKNWRDFWDIKNFPGRRALMDRDVTVEAALLADGVPRDKLYPVDLDRVLKKVAEIKPNINAWYNNGATMLQLATSEEVDTMSIWSPELDDAIRNGSSFTYTYNDGFLTAGCLAIAKGAPHKDLAMKLIAGAVSPEAQADLPKYTTAGPANQKAFETGKITPEQARKSNSSPENLKLQIIQDVSWWADHYAEVLEKFTALIQR